MEQLSLFDFKEQAAPKKTTSGIEPNDWALVYLVTKAGGAKGNLWVLKKEDAMKLCEDDCSHGIARGGRWMFNWTSLSHFTKDDDGAKQHKDVHGTLKPFVFLFDTGKQDADFQRLGITKPYPSEVSDILRHLGYRMTYQNAEQEKLAKEGEIILRQKLKESKTKTI